MKKSFILTILFLAPFIILTVGMEVLLRHIPNFYMTKADYMDKNASKIKILVLGSSHGVTGIDPEQLSKPAFNMANYAQTLDNDFDILNNYKDKLDSLEYIILPVSYHSLWAKLAFHPQKWRTKYYNIYYGIRVEHNPTKELLLLDQPIKKDFDIIKSYYWDKEPLNLNLSPYGLAITPSQTNLAWMNSKVDELVDSHSVADLTYLYDENVSYLQGVIDIAKKKNAKVIFVTIPAHHIFVERLHPDQLNLLYKTMDKLVDGKNVFYYNCLNDFTKEDEVTSLKYFRDADHLSHLGAEVFSQKLDSIIQVIDQKK